MHDIGGGNSVLMLISPNDCDVQEIRSQVERLAGLMSRSKSIAPYCRNTFINFDSPWQAICHHTAADAKKSEKAQISINFPLPSYI
jgi:hypothetical protein